MTKLLTKFLLVLMLVSAKAALAAHAVSIWTSGQTVYWKGLMEPQAPMPPAYPGQVVPIHTQSTTVTRKMPNGNLRTASGSSYGGTATFVIAEAFMEGVWVVDGIESVYCPAGKYNASYADHDQITTWKSYLAQTKVAAIAGGAKYAEVSSCNSRCRKGAGVQTSVPCGTNCPAYGWIIRTGANDGSATDICSDYVNVQFVGSTTPTGCYDKSN